MAKELYVKGKCSWAMLINPDYKYNADGVWSIRLYPDAASLAEIEKLRKGSPGIAGIMNHLKRDEDGDYMAFKRKAIKNRKGAKVPQTPPAVVDEEGKPLPNVRIGDGSDVTIKLRYYDYPQPGSTRGSAVEIQAVMVHNLVEFQTSQYTEAEAAQVAGLTDQPKPKF